jgi:2-(1,2-epoxy-1,2-dihydrophenyl)acetyl-CoA isomerase
MLNDVLPDEELLGHTQEVAARLAQAPTKAVALIKRAVNQAHELTLERVLDLEVNYQTIASRDPNFAEGVAAFRAKRPPKFNR